MGSFCKVMDIVNKDNLIELGKTVSSEKLPSNLKTQTFYITSLGKKLMKRIGS